MILLDPKKPIAKFQRSLLAGWAAWLVVYGAWIAWVPGESEVGRTGFYVLSSGFFSVLYLIDYAVIAPLAFVALNLSPRTAQSWLWALIGALLFAATVPLWELIGGQVDWSEIALPMGFTGLAGAVAFYVLRVINPVAAPST